MLQKVEHFPWEILKTQENLASNLCTSAGVKLVNADGTRPQDELDRQFWLALRKFSVISSQYIGIQTTLFNMLWRGRSGDDRNDMNLLITFQNKLLAFKFNDWIRNQGNHTLTSLIKSISNCLGIGEIIVKGNDDGCRIPADKEMWNNYLKLLSMIKRKFCKNLVIQIYLEKPNSTNPDNDYIRLFKFLIFKSHKCKEFICDVHCTLNGKLDIPRKPKTTKFLRLFL